MAAAELLGNFALFAALVLVACALLFYILSQRRRAPKLARLAGNPVLSPIAGHWWENEAVFNPAAVVHGGRVHLFYRALGRDGISRIGYASSPDGIHFDERSPTPVYEPRQNHIPDPRKLSYATLTYNTATFASGGGWGGSEDPRAVVMDGHLYMTFTAFQNWSSERISLVRLPLGDLDARRWNWSLDTYLSPPGEVQKNWVIFPDKIQGKYAILHSLSPKIAIDYVSNLAEFDGTKFIKGSFRSGGRAEHWDAVVRGAGAPPIKTPHGWLLLYHGFDPDHGAGYNVGAMLLDLNDPTTVLARSEKPILKPEHWYENEPKWGVVYASGAVEFNDELFVYYGAGDGHVAAARANLGEFIDQLMHHQNALLTPVTI